jgi:hypothetical protein
MLTCVKILLQCVNIYAMCGRLLRTGESVKAGFGSLYDSQVDKMSA